MTTNERFIETAEKALGLTDDDRGHLRVLVCIDLLIAQAGITDEQVGWRMRTVSELKSRRRLIP